MGERLPRPTRTPCTQIPLPGSRRAGPAGRSGSCGVPGGLQCPLSPWGLERTATAGGVAGSVVGRRGGRGWRRGCRSARPTLGAPSGAPRTCSWEPWDPAPGPPAIQPPPPRGLPDLALHPSPRAGQARGRGGGGLGGEVGDGGSLERLPLPSLLIPLPQAVFPRLRLCSDSPLALFFVISPSLAVSTHDVLLFLYSVPVPRPLSTPCWVSLRISHSPLLYTCSPTSPRHSLSNLVLIFSPSPCPSHSFRPASRPCPVTS